MTTNATAAARPRYSESLHVLIDRRTREVIMGLAVDDTPVGARAKEGETIRELLHRQLSRLPQHERERLRESGRAELLARETEAASRKAAVEA